MLDRCTGELLTHYRNLMMLATIQADKQENPDRPEVIAVDRLSMKQEFDGLASFPSLHPLFCPPHPR